MFRRLKWTPKLVNHCMICSLICNPVWVAWQHLTTKVGQNWRRKITQQAVEDELNLSQSVQCGVLFSARGFHGCFLSLKVMNLGMMQIWFQHPSCRLVFAGNCFVSSWSKWKRPWKLVSGFKHVWLSISYMDIWDVILPIDELIFVKMGMAPPTRKLPSGYLT